MVATGQFSIIDMNDITVSDVAPSNPLLNGIWLDTTTNTLKKYNGTEWVHAVDYTNDDLAKLAINNQIITATTEEGKIFHLTDSADTNCKSVEIIGESIQDTVQSHNLYTAGESLQYGAVYPENMAEDLASYDGYDNVVHIKGPVGYCTIKSNDMSNGYYNNIKAGDKVTVLLLIKYVGSTSARLFYGYQINVYQDLIKYKDVADGWAYYYSTFTFPLDATNFDPLFHISSDGELYISKLQVTMGEEPKDFQPYYEVASPDKPTPIESVSGKNLFNNTYNNLAMWQGVVGEETTFGESDNYLGAYCKVEPGKTYSVSRVKITNRFVIALCKEIPSVTATGLVYRRDDTATKIENITIPDGYNYLAFYLSNSGEDATGVNLQVEKGTNATFYVPYNHIGFKSNGKNKFDIDTFKALNSYNRYENYNGIECLRLLGNTITYNFDGKENTQYTFKLNIIGETTNDIGMWQFVYSDGTTSDILYVGNVTGIKVATSSANKTIKGIKWNAWSSGSSVYIDKNSMQLEEGPATEYEPYKESITTIPLLHDMRSLPNGVRDRIYESDSKWYDTQKLESIILNGTENWIAGDTLGDYKQFALQAQENQKLPPADKTNVICSHFEVIRDVVWSTQRNSIWVSTNGNMYIKIHNSIAENLEEFKTWLANNNVEVIYELETPIVTEIIDGTTITALESIKTFKGITNITTDAPSILTYYRDIPMVDEYETRQNAEKNYKTTREKFAQQEITNDEIKSTVSSIETTISNDMVTKEELNTQITQTANDITFEVNKSINDIRNNGVSKVVSKTVTVSDKGLTVGASDSEYKNTMDTTGNYQSYAGEIIAKYDKDGADIPKLKSDIGIIAGIKYTKEIINGVKHHKQYVIE